MKTTMDKYIKQLRTFIDNPMQVYEKYVLEITYAVLWQMAYHTIWDTGQARGLIIKKFVDNFSKVGINMSYDDLIKASSESYWGNDDRYFGNLSGNNLEVLKQNKTYQINQSIDDDALFAQENADGTPSGKYGNANYPSFYPIRDNTGFRTRHIQYVIDSINNKQYGNIKKLDIDKLTSDMVKSVEKFLFK